MYLLELENPENQIVDFKIFKKFKHAFSEIFNINSSFYTDHLIPIDKHNPFFFEPKFISPEALDSHDYNTCYHIKFKNGYSILLCDWDYEDAQH